MFSSFVRSLVVGSVVYGLLATPAAAAPQPKCLVQVNAGKLFAGNGKLLARKIGAASPGDTIHIGGRCTGLFVIGTDLDLVGDLTSGDTFLLGGAAGTVLTIAAGVTVSVSDLGINGGVAATGGGVVNDGNLTLASGSIVLGNNEGGGVLNNGTLTMTDDAQIAVNFSFGSGAGLYNTGTAVIGGDARIHSNTSVTAPFATLGGGIFNSGTLTLRDNASVSDNIATVAGGIFNDGSFTLEGNASVVDNRATTEGGGIDEGANSVVTVDPAWSGSTCDPANTPNDYDASNGGTACP